MFVHRVPDCKLHQDGGCSACMYAMLMQVPGGHLLEERVGEIAGCEGRKGVH